ncbi:DUF4147 domain-containing protein, partial [Candidatus Saccharibacteria bacterium]|nr:DUF4147 domain-containing protein [Candidatus Saccharibacteria bacterium]
MMHYIQNLRTLATTPARADALAIAEAGLAAIDTETVLRNTLRLAGDTLTIQGTQFSLGDFRHIYVVGFGKVACTAALTLEELLAGRVADGAVVGIKEKVCQVVDTYAGTHPLPSSLNYTATRHIEEVARRATADDLVLVVVSGGGSALLCSSMSECEQGTRLFSSFLPSGGTIEELNIVRKHISTLKGGGLAKTLYPATVASLVFSDVPGGDMAAVASGPTCQDSSTIDDARAIIERYQLGTFNLVETPKDDKYFTNVHNFLVASNEVALEAMAAEATKRGYQSEILAKTQYATPEETQSLLTKQAAPGTVYLVGGETKLVIPDNCTGKGGRNDYLALHMLEALMPGQVFVSLASDGKDNTTAAGALADAETARKAAQAGLNVTDYEPCRNSFPFFDTVGDHIVTGPLESNVSDLMMLLNPGHTSKRQPAPIESITAEVIKDSRGKDTIAVTVAVGGETGTFSVPSGASTGSREVHAKPAKEAVRIVKKVVAPALCGHNVHDQQGLDERLHTLDSTPLFDVIGGNTALGVSVAALKASAAVQGVEPWQYVAEL